MRYVSNAIMLSVVMLSVAFLHYYAVSLRLVLLRAECRGALALSMNIIPDQGQTL
jgi:hypothetical protein